jgi:hypothetical protein
MTHQRTRLANLARFSWVFISRLRKDFTKTDDVAASFYAVLLAQRLLSQQFPLAKCYTVTLDAAMMGIMGFVRSQRRWGAWAGLAALALQIVLSFGHLHRDDLGLPPLPAASHQIVVGAALAPSAPADQDHYPQPDDYCPVCASMVLAATAIPSLPPTLIAPIAVHYAWPSQAAIGGLSAKLTLSFRARGPPSI